ncbi:MAG: hypothetical protein ABIG44_09375 [Planctomycetota bacterium]
MLIAPSTTRVDNRRRLAKASGQAEIPVRLHVIGAELSLATMSWSAYLQPVQEYVEYDRRLVHRLVQLKKSWRSVLRLPTSALHKRMYCWRYFLLLHQTLQIARTEPERGDPIPMLQRIVSFESFPIEGRGLPGIAGGAMSNRHPVFLLGRLAPNPPLSTPRHLPLVLPLGQTDPYYFYRQLRLSTKMDSSLLVFPASNLSQRAESFGPIDRAARLLSSKPDPHSYPRARLLAQRVLIPLAMAQRRAEGRFRSGAVSILDIGAGTGHVVANAWQEVMTCGRLKARFKASLHFIDAAGPCAGRSFGLSREANGIASIEWTTADYRTLLDDDAWLDAHRPVEWAFFCRVLCNASTIAMEHVEGCENDDSDVRADSNPARCLAPRRQPDGLANLEVRTVRRRLANGIVMPQWSLTRYFAAMKAASVRDVGVVTDDQCCIPIRRFNPAALITERGKSVLHQLLNVATAIVIEDPDMLPADLVGHARQFGLNEAGIIHCTQDGVQTEVEHFIVAKQNVVKHLPGERLW